MLRLLSLGWIILIGIFVGPSEGKHGPSSVNETRAIVNKIWKLKQELAELASPYLRITVNDVPGNCVQMQCKLICFKGKANEIEKDIGKVVSSSRFDCETLEELRLYNYEFPNDIIKHNFLGVYGNQIQSIYIANSNVTDVEAGAFGDGIFQKIELENLQLVGLHKSFFQNISSNFQSLTILQQEPPIESICDDFLDYVRYKIKYLTLQVGIGCIRNMTAGNNLLNQLGYVDFSYNNFGRDLLPNAFNMASMVEHLDLSHSKITSLPNGIFNKLMYTLEYLDISNNHLKTISSAVFGWGSIPIELKIYANDNDWDCDCNLRKEMKIIFPQQTAKIYCVTPEEYVNWFVFDDRLCEEHHSTNGECRNCGGLTTNEDVTSATDTINTNWPSTTTRDGTTMKTTTMKTTSIGIASTTSNPILDSNVELHCHHKSDPLTKQAIKLKRPTMEFNLTPVSGLRVEVTLMKTDLLNEEYGLIWFSNVTKEYHKMEVNYNEYGLGCHRIVSYLTIVENLTPNVAYTFCLVHKEHLTISPFNCKSAHISTNLGVRYNAWLTRDLRATGISVTILGIVIFTFAGIAAIFLVLKKKPTLLKGSKRIATQKGNANEIIVLPKDRTMEDLRLKEEMLAKRYSKSNISSIQPRRNSIESIDSNQSYMNANLYEELPAYLKLDGNMELSPDNDNGYQHIPPLTMAPDAGNLVSYAEIPFRHKRTSNDPLPEVPKEEMELTLTNTDATEILKQEIHLYSGYAFTYDCAL